MFTRKAKIRKLSANEFLKLRETIVSFAKAQDNFIESYESKTHFSIAHLKNDKIKEIKKETWEVFENNGYPGATQEDQKNGTWYFDYTKWDKNKGSHLCTIKTAKTFVKDLDKTLKISETFNIAKEMSSEYLSSENGKKLAANLFKEADKICQVFLDCSKVSDHLSEKEISKIIKLRDLTLLDNISVTPQDDALDKKTPKDELDYMIDSISKETTVDSILVK